MIVAMLSPTTLAAFSANAAQLGFAPANPVQRVQSVTQQAAPTRTPAVPAMLSPSGRDGANLPSRQLPRGSLLDMSV